MQWGYFYLFNLHIYLHCPVEAKTTYSRILGTSQQGKGKAKATGEPRATARELQEDIRQNPDLYEVCQRELSRKDHLTTEQQSYTGSFLAPSLGLALRLCRCPNLILFTGTE